MGYPSEQLSSKLEGVLVIDLGLWARLVSVSSLMCGDSIAVLNMLMLFFVQAMAADNSDKWFAAQKMKKAAA